jgi:hypothetical protein
MEQGDLAGFCGGSRNGSYLAIVAALVDSPRADVGASGGVLFACVDADARAGGAGADSLPGDAGERACARHEH